MSEGAKKGREFRRGAANKFSPAFLLLGELTHVSKGVRVRTPSDSEVDQPYKLRIDPVATAPGSDTPSSGP